MNENWVRGQWHRRAISAAAMAMALSGCGGGSGDGAGGGTVNTAPSFTSAGTASVAENTANAVYQAAATDAQNDAITYSIAGGADASAFTLSGGSLSFVEAPNYDLPGDANGDNVYEVTLQASDGKLSSSLDLALTVTNDREGISVKRIATGLVDPVGIASLGTGSDLLVAGKDNVLYSVTGATGAVAQSAPVIESYGNIQDVELLGVSVAAGWGNRDRPYILFASNGSAYINCFKCNVVLPQYVGPRDANSTIALGKGPDGKAYVAVGDIAGTQAQDSSSAAGSLFRVEPVEPYSLPSLQYFYLPKLAIGLRAPAGISALPSGKLVIADRGGKEQDELSLTSTLTNTASFQGTNFGWPYFEGTKEVNAGGAAIANLITPSLTIPLGDGPRQSRGIGAGVAYTGSIVGIANMYVFTDKDGRIWSIPLAQLQPGTTLDGTTLEVRDEDFEPDAGTIDHPIGMTIDGNGTLYILDSDGELFRVDAA